MRGWSLIGSLVMGIAGCTLYDPGDPGADVVDGGAGVDGAQPRSPLALPLDPPQPAANPTSAAKVALGRLLFWDPILSGDRDVACATCHDPELAYTDGVRTPVGVGRNSMSILDAAWNGSTVTTPVPRAEDAPMFWDNRAHSLEEQARGPITAAAEMMGTSFTEDTIFPELVARLSAIPDYVSRFSAAFGSGGITEANILAAIAAFERTLTAPETSYDRFVNGDSTAMTPQAQRGLQIFKANGCANCHSGPMFSDYELHELRVPDAPGAPHDAGDGANRFRTASLRGVTLTAPYMHNGLFPSFREVFGFYRQAGQNTTDPKLRGVIPPSPEQALDFIAFLAALGDGEFDRSIPTSVPSGLPPGG
jgi:cytochrome c peroxidase